MAAIDLSTPGGQAAVSPPSTVHFDVDGARKAGYSDVDIASYLGSQTNFNAPAAIKAGYAAQDIIKYLTPQPEAAPPESPPVKDPGMGAQIIPALTESVTGGIPYAEALGNPVSMLEQSYNTFAPIAGAKPIPDTYMLGSTEHELNTTLPSAANPENTPAVTPSERALRAAVTLGASALVPVGGLEGGGARILADAARNIPAMAAAGAIGSGAAELVPDEWKPLVSNVATLVAGAGLGHATGIPERAAAARREAAAPVAVMEAPDIDAAIAQAEAAISEPADVDAMAATAQAQGEVNDRTARAEEAAAPPELAQEDDTAAPPPDTDARDQFLDTGEMPDLAPMPAQARPQPAPQEPAYTNALTKATTMQRWLGELDEQRRQEAAASPQAKFLQQTIDVILGKVAGVEDRLTGAAAARLEKARQSLDDLLNPEADSPDMAKVRAAMVAEHQRMADAAAPPPKAPTVVAAAEEPPSAANGSTVSAVTREEIHAVAQSKGVPSDNAPAFMDATAAITGKAHLDELTQPELVQVRDVLAASPEIFKGTSESAPSSESPVTFKTAKGSTYVVNEDGTTTRDKAARSDLGHEGQQGPQPVSEHTYYVTPAQADALSLVQTHGGRMAVEEHPSGAIGVKYLDGKDAGKFERRTMVQPQTEPAVGLIPVETWKNGERVHFGNEIVSVSTPATSPSEPLTAVAPPSAEPAKAPRTAVMAFDSGARPAVRYADLTAKPQVAVDPNTPTVRAKALKPIEGTGAQRERAINGALYNVGEEAPQMARAADLVESDPERALAIAMRQKQPPAGVHPEFVFMALEEKATREGNVELQRQLATSRIAEEATTMGQRIAAWRNRGEISPVDDMRRIREARETMAAQRGAADPQAMVADAQAAIRKAAKSTKRPAWNDFVLSLSCGAGT